MESHYHSMTDLFDQLGLPSDYLDINEFIDKYHILTANTTLCDAYFWTITQSRFLSEQISIDADWAVVVDRLDCSLRH